MKTLKTIVLAASMTALFTSVGNAQTMRASCDNRSGTTFADVVDSSDPTQAGYNVDPSEIFRQFAAISFPVNQSSGANSATATETINSKFLGANPGTRITGFVSTCTGNAAATRSNLTVKAQSADNQRICFDVTGASAATPLRIRLNGALTLTGGSTGLVRLRNPANAVVQSITTGSLNRVINITTNGTYSLDATFDTGMINMTSGTGTQTRAATVNAAVTCIADFNGNGTISVQDIFDFLAAYFAGSTAADSNANGSIAVQDIFDFLAVYFSGCV